jgi:cytochrome c-type biogenesis protein CcmH/NrfG
MTDRQTRDEQRRRAALRDLERTSEQGEIIGTSALRRAAENARDHFGAAETQSDDWAELWGRRIGRGLSLIGLVGLAIYLTVTYLL